MEKSRGKGGRTSANHRMDTAYTGRSAGGGAAGFVYRRNVAEQKIGRTEAYANQLLEDATRKADEYKKEKVLEAKEENSEGQDRERSGNA